MRSIALAAAAVFCSAVAVAEGIDARAVAVAKGFDVSSRAIVEYCAGSKDAATLRGNWQAWRTANGIDSLMTRVAPDTRATIERQFGSAFQDSVTAKLKRLGNAESACHGMTDMWQSPEFDLHRNQPQLFANDSRAQGPAAAGPMTRAATAAAASVPVTASASAGVYYTPAQLTSLVNSWRKAGDYENMKRILRSLGPVYIQGQVVHTGTSYFINSTDGVFTSRVSVAPDIDISRFDRQTITIQGEFDGIPSSPAFMRNTRIVRDASGLKPSPLDSDAGLYRLDVANDRVSTTPGKGIAGSEIHGVLYRGYGAMGGNGYEFREEVTTLLKDGSAYVGTRIALDSLDKAKSRTLQPELWGQWRKAGAGYELQRQDDRGHALGWKKAEGSLLPAWRGNERLGGSYTLQQFSGSIALGGMYSSSTIAFGRDGRFERIRFSQASSGSLAQTGSGFSASASSHSDGKGSSSVAGGGNNGEYTGASNYTLSSHSSKDGSGNRGSYVLNGYTLQLRYDNGDVENLQCAPWDTTYSNLVINGKTYSIDKASGKSAH